MLNQHMRKIPLIINSFFQKNSTNPVVHTPPSPRPEVLHNQLNLYTVKQFATMQTVYTEPALRNLIFKASPRKYSKGDIKTNGLIECGAIIRVQSKVLIDPEQFGLWARQNGGV